MIRSKLPNVKTSIFAVMSALANKHGAVNLSQGFPDFQISEELISLTQKYMQKGYNQYAPMQGVMALREIISVKTEKLYKQKYNPDTEITVTAGGTQALYSAITAFINDGDEVIVFEPAYDSYVPVIQLNGGIPVFITLQYPNYKINWDDVNKLVSSRTKMIILNSPHNPSGKVLSEEDIKQLHRIVAGTKIIILSDEVYEHIIFDKLTHQSIAKYPELAKRSLIVSSFGKTFHATGWKTGYCVAPEALMKEFRRVHQFTVYAANTPIQYALAEFLEQEDNYLNLGAFYQKKRDFFATELAKTKLDFTPSSGTYFQAADYSKISDAQDTEVANKLTIDFGIAAIPMSAFYHDTQKSTILRFCFAKSEATLTTAVARLIEFGKQV